MEVLEGRRETTKFPKKEMVWGQFVPSKVVFHFFGEVWCGQNHEFGSAQEKGFCFFIRCYSWEENEVGVEHLLLHSPKVWAVWSSELAAAGVFWVFSGSVKRSHLLLEQDTITKRWRKILKDSSLLFVMGYLEGDEWCNFLRKRVSLDRLKNSFLYSFGFLGRGLLGCSDSLLIRKLMLIL